MHLIRTSTYQIMSGLFECIFNIKSKCITDNPGFICTLQSNFFLIQWVYIVLWKTNIKIWFALAKEGTFLTIFTILFPFLLEDLRIVFVLFFISNCVHQVNFKKSWYMKFKSICHCMNISNHFQNFKTSSNMEVFCGLISGKKL